MENTPKHNLPYIMAAQAQKHVTHNEALRMLDTLVQLSVIQRDLLSPPSVLENGDCYLIAASASGDWQGHDNEIAAWQDGAWVYSKPQAGWLCWIGDEQLLLVWDGIQWTQAIDDSNSINPTPLVGVNMTADETNRLSVASDSSIFSHSGTSHQLKINKDDVSNTASILFQDDWSGHAEVGLTGDNDLHIKVSPDGSVFHDGLVIDQNTGYVSAPNGGFREQLIADLDLYVRTDGNDNNPGDSDSSTGAFATISHAMAVIVGLDCGTFAVTVHVADGTYNETVVLPLPLAGSVFSLQGSGSGCQISTIRGAQGSRWLVGGFKLTASGSNQLLAEPNCIIKVTQHVEFTQTSASHCYCLQGAKIQFDVDYTISGGAYIHWRCDETGATIFAYGRTVTLTNTPAFSLAFAYFLFGSMAIVGAMTFVGSATGTRYQVAYNSAVQASGANYLPGDIAGIVYSGGVHG